MSFMVDSDKRDMISVGDTVDYSPHGRQFCAAHPGRISLQVKSSSSSSSSRVHGLPLVKALKDISIQDNLKKEFWYVRQSKDGQGLHCEEELYVCGQTVVWSQGNTPSTQRVIKSFTVDTPVQEALWCNFLLPKAVVEDEIDKTGVLMGEVQTGICVVEAGAISVYTTQGKDYMAALPFEVSQTWVIKNGLLFERSVPQAVFHSLKRDQQNLPIVFSMLHPLDEVAPVISKTGGSGSLKVNFISDSNQQIVFTSEDPSLVMTYDTVVGVHSVWNVRRAKPEEGYLATGSNYMDTTSNLQGPLGTPGQSSSSLSRLTISSQSPSISPFRSRINSPVQTQSRIQSPTISHMGALSRSGSPSVTAGSLHRLYQTPSPKPRSPAAFARTPVSMVASSLNESYSEVAEPLAPEICLEHTWSETTTARRDASIGKASKVFLTTDLTGQQYLCYLISFRHQLRCVKFEESNDKSQLIFGAVSVIPARDAVSLPGLNMLLILDISASLVLYTGISKVNKVHVSGVPSMNLSLNFSSSFPAPANFSPRTENNTPYDSPASGGFITSSRPASAMDCRFDEVNLSPVPTELNDSTQAFNNSITDFALQGTGTIGFINALRDTVANKFTLDLVNGGMIRSSLPLMCSNPVVGLCLEAIKNILPRDNAIQVMIRWYTTNNAPGSTNSESEWIHFVKCLLSMMGYDSNKIPFLQQTDTDESVSPVMAAKKARPSDQGTDEDWEYLLSSEHHQAQLGSLESSLGLCSVHAIPTASCENQGGVEQTSLLYTHIPALLFALHLVYEELKLDALFLDGLLPLATLLMKLAHDLRASLYVDYYCRDHPCLNGKIPSTSPLTEEQLQHMHSPTFFPVTPPSIYKWLHDLLQGHEVGQFPYLISVSTRTRAVVSLYVVLLNKDFGGDISCERFLKKISAVGHRTAPSEDSLMKSFSVSISNTNTTSSWERAVLCMTELGTSLIDKLPFGISLPLRDAIYHCRHNPPSDWPEHAYVLIGRQDLARQKRNEQNTIVTVKQSEATPSGSKSNKDEEDGMEYMDQELLRLRFPDDLRVQEVRRLLQSAKPVKVALTQRPEVSDHDFIEEQERYLYATCIRTLALPLGRGMFTLFTYHPVATEMMSIPKLCLTGRAPPRNTTVDLSHIDTPQNMNAWPLFHNGVAAGLRIADSSQVDSTWIIYNKPRNNELTNEHAGFLMALGLNGHLNNLTTLNVHDYLCKGNEMTSVGILLGLAAAKRGTMDIATTKVLSVHVMALLPPTSTELTVPHNMQVAAILGVGLVYQGTAHRHIAEVLLSEIGRPPGPEMDNCVDRESYSLASGLALGMVMLGRGSEVMGLSDLNMADTLYHYVVGGYKRPLTGANKERYKSPSYQIKEGDSVNIDVTAPGATMALGMMFFNTSNSAVADWLKAPDTQFLLDFVRPDFLMLRIISRGLIMWDFVYPSDEWINSNLPEIVSKYAFRKKHHQEDPDCDIDFETMSLAYCNIVTGACMVIGLKFAGSANHSAFQCLMEKSKKLLRFLSKPDLIEQTGKSTAESCLVVMVLSLAMVMAGTGNLEVLRLCRHLRARIGPLCSHVLYGSHMAISMAIGLLFLGGGRYTLSTQPEAVAAMLCAFFPKFPIHSNDNRYHLQAFRHLYVLATEPRMILPKDVDTGKPCYVPLKVKFRNTLQYEDKWYTIMAPCILPQLNLIEEVQVMGPRYWPITFQIGKNWNTLKQILKGNGWLFVKQIAGYLSYHDDPKGYLSVSSHSVTGEFSAGKSIQSDDIKSFSSDPHVLAFAEYFCCSKNEQEFEMLQLLLRVLYECVTQEKTEIVSTHVAMDQVVQKVTKHSQSLLLWQLKLVLTYFEHSQRENIPSLVNEEFLCALKNRIDSKLDYWSASNMRILSSYLQCKSPGNHQLHLLASYLTWYNIPHPNQLASADAPSSSRPCLAELYLRLNPLGLSMPTVMKLHQVLTDNAVQ